MNRNTKIALGCGGGGCLGLIILGVIGAAIYFFVLARPNYNSPYNANTNINRGTNRNSNSSTPSSNINSSSSTSSTSNMSDDDKHKLWQAASITGDAELIQRVNVKIGIVNADFTLGDNYKEFALAHVSWALNNRDFIQEVSTAEKGRAYVNEHL